MSQMFGLSTIIVTFFFYLQTGMFSIGGKHYLIEPLNRDAYSKEHFNESENIPHQVYPLKYTHNTNNSDSDSTCGVTSNTGEYRTIF